MRETLFWLRIKSLNFQEEEGYDSCTHGNAGHNDEAKSHTKTEIVGSYWIWIQRISIVDKVVFSVLRPEENLQSVPNWRNVLQPCQPPHNGINVRHISCE